MTGITYSSCVASLQNLAPVAASDPNFATDLPNIIDDAEFQCYTDLDLLNTVAIATATLSASTRSFNLPSTNGTFIVTQGFNVITPSGTTNPDAGTRNPLTPTTKEALNFLWPSTAGSTVPVYMAPVTQSSWIVGPWPDVAYTVEVSGTIRPAALSSTNTTTLLSVYFPALFIAACMVRLSGYMKNYGAAVDDPKMAVTWSARYQGLLQGAEVEEARKKFSAAGWSDKQPAPLATPPRV
jgi:hypothetical protein